MVHCSLRKQLQEAKQKQLVQQQHQQSVDTEKSNTNSTFDQRHHSLKPLTADPDKMKKTVKLSGKKLELDGTVPWVRSIYSP